MTLICTLLIWGGALFMASAIEDIPLGQTIAWVMSGAPPQKGELTSIPSGGQ